MIGIKDVAKKAGVSPSTVSNVINGRTNVGEKTKERVQRVMQDLHYEPNIIGKTLKTGSSRTIMFSFSDFERKFYLSIIRGISEYVKLKDYDLIICTNKSTDKFMNRAFTNGCILLDRRTPDSFLIKKANKNYPIVVMDRIMEVPNIKSVVVNNYASERALVQGLVDLKYKNFAFLGGFESEDNRERFRAFSDVLKENNIPFKKDHYYDGDYTGKSGYQMARLIMLSEHRPDVLVCANDEMAMGAIRAFRENGIKVPEDIAVCGFDDTETAKMMGITTVDVPNYERGYLAAQCLVEMIEGSKNFDPFLINSNVKWRSTTLIP
ncbi:MAG: LacI family DNA-binding transcriptional regulator [Lachnospiraceae bacterium]|jgi:LacI family transcriptional regulator|nr:LacI family DNA-binding transcriptional regulator [Lachnospiraceae bacterium]